MAKDKEALFTEKGSHNNLQKFCLALVILAGVGLCIGLIAYLASNPPRNSSNYVVSEPEYPSSARYAINNGEKWLMDYQVTSMGMMNNENADAFLALRLGLMSKYRPGSCEYNTFSKAVEYDLLASSMRNKLLDGYVWVRSLLSKYIIALAGACVDPTNFHGMDLLQTLEYHYNNYTAHFSSNPADTAMLVLAKCVSGKMSTSAQLSQLEALTTFSSVDEASLAVLALSCVNATTYYTTIMRAETYLMANFANNSFGNTYQTGLAIQALTRLNSTQAENAISQAQLHLAKEIQNKRMGKFLTIGEAANVLPALARMSWADVKGKCPTKRVLPYDPSGPNVTVTIQVNGTGTDVSFAPIDIAEGKSLLDALNKLQSGNSGFMFMAVKTSYGHVLTTVMGEQIDMKSGKRWHVILSGSPTTQEMYLDRIFPEDGSKYILRME